MTPEAIRFIRKRKWEDTDGRILDIPWDEIVNACFAAWQDIQDETFAGNVLPDAKLRGRYFDLLGREDTTQDEWDTFNDAVRDHVEAMDYGQLADWYVQMHDPNTIVIVLYLHDGIEYLEEECAMPWKRDR